jgi:folate-dependent phosphoribosylglycinamide formyltransferase PurN
VLRQGYRPVELAREGALWIPGNARVALESSIGRSANERAGYTDEDHLAAAIAWLERAHDAGGDGGVSGRYLLGKGWTSSYPETTGYIIPTLLTLATKRNCPRLTDRAARCIDFLARVQLGNGAFPGAEIRENSERPSVFNTAQILNGLVAWHRATGDARAERMAHRAADWLVDVQDADGAWRRDVYQGVAVSYAAHASCWLADYADHFGSDRHRRASLRHLDWVLGNRSPDTGWFDLSGWGDDHAARIAVTHTIAYTLAGVLHTSAVFGIERGVDAVRVAARAIARRLELNGSLPGVLDHRWRARSRYVCLTGNAQMALIWLRLHALDPEPLLLNAALKAIDEVKRAQPMTHPNPGIRGGIPGSNPIWGDYIRLGLPNWAAKFFIDALLTKEAALAAVGRREPEGWQIPGDVPRALPPSAPRSTQPGPRIILYTRPGSAKVGLMLDAWSAWGFRCAAVVIEEPADPSPWDRVTKKLREDGVDGVLARLVARQSVSPTAAGARHDGDADDPITAAASRGIPVVRVRSLNSDDAVARVRALDPDLAIHAGAGILRAPLLAIPHLGTLNAHMGILPRFRGMNVTEWARFTGAPVGCTVHLIDSGIDTGDVLQAAEVDVSGAHSIDELRDVVDRAQIALLGEVVRWISTTGSLPPRRKQTAEEGVQFFRMHSALRAVLEHELASEAKSDEVRQPAITLSPG